MPPPATYKLYYAARGRGEAIQQLFKLVSIPVEEVCLAPEEWPAFKPKTPFGQLPILEVIEGNNGSPTQIAQSQAIMRFIGQEYGLAGGNNLENAQLDMVGDLIADAAASKGISEWKSRVIGLDQLDEKNPQDCFEARVLPELHKFAEIFENFLRGESKSNRSIWAGEKVTWAALLAAEFFIYFQTHGDPNCLEDFPLIRELIGRVRAAVKKGSCGGK